jgi:hypothetical protein
MTSSLQFLDPMPLAEIERRVDRTLQESAPLPRISVPVISHPGSKCRNRMFEWIMAVNLILIAITLTIAPNSISHSRFWLITEYGIGPVAILFYCLVVGLLRGLTLYWNGTWPVYGPKVRALGCALGAVVWSQLALALAGASRVDAISIIIPILAGLTVGELCSCYRALIDGAAINAQGRS